MSIDGTLVTTYGQRAAEVISEAAEEAWRAVVRREGVWAKPIYKFAEISERLYTQHSDRDPRDPLTAEMLVEAICSELGYCVTRVGSKLIVED